MRQVFCYFWNFFTQEFRYQELCYQQFLPNTICAPIQFGPDTVCALIQFVTRYNLCPIQFVPDTICVRYKLCRYNLCRYNLFPIQFVHEPSIQRTGQCTQRTEQGTQQTDQCTQRTDQCTVHSGLTSVHSRQTSVHSGLAQGTWRNSHEACLPIGCMWGGRGTGPENAVALQKGHGRVGQKKFCHVTQNPQKRHKSAINFFDRLMSPTRPPVRIICSSLDKPQDN